MRRRAAVLYVRSNGMHAWIARDKAALRGAGGKYKNHPDTRVVLHGISAWLYAGHSIRATLRVTVTPDRRGSLIARSRGAREVLERGYLAIFDGGTYVGDACRDTFTDMTGIRARERFRVRVKRTTLR